MIFKKKLLLLTTLCLLNIIHSFAYAITNLNSLLYFSENPITFDPPMIQKNTTVFLPIRSLVQYFDGSIKKSNITYEYEIIINKTKLTIKPNIVTYKLNGKTKKFNIKPFIFNTRLYVPLESIIQDLGYQLIKKNEHFYAYAGETNTSINSSIKIDLDYKDTNHSVRTKEMFLPISRIRLPIDTHYFNGTQKTDLTEFLSYLGYSINTIENYFILKKKKTVYSFKNGSNKVKISTDKNIITKTIPYRPSIKSGRLFVQIQPFLNDLGFDYLRKNNQIIILKKLNQIIVDDKSELILKKNSQINIHNGNQLANPNRVYWDLNYTKCPNKPINLNLQSIKRITFGQRNTTCRMVFYLNDGFMIKTNKISPTTITFNFKKQTNLSKSPLAATKPIKQKLYKKQTLRGKTIVIDPGHGGNDPGAVRKNDYEKHYTLDISKRIQRKLISKGAKVVMLRTKDTNPSLYQRVKKTNRSKADFLISVHVNSFINNKANGTETYYYKKNEKLAAKYIQKHLAKNLNLKNNGIKQAKMYVLKYSKIPGVLIEPCFMTNKKEYALLKTIAFREKIANATVTGLEEYFKNK
tara:strand:- start:88664 stop:90400 length:1737 start_codon:yes stop_codon:yes gene_type:complete